ncbi:MAG: DUF1361 domain-containing protein [Verrucomicrobiaceae bacterium]|nr:DUF1361 domain-containing protein [Verrucomicrobiaceae bacterium]
MSTRVILLKTAACLTCAALLFIRMKLTGSSYFSFMLWNLFLAVIPLAFALQLPRTRSFSRALPVLAVWLLFFPNAPYVLTDLIHLRPHAGIPLWFDLVMLLAFALTALWIGFHSLHLVQAWITRHSNARAGWLAVLVIMPLTGFGIYLGRFLRWNSWDIVTHPWSLFQDIAALVLDPVRHHAVWTFTLVFSALLMLAYLAWIFAAPHAKSQPGA